MMTRPSPKLSRDAPNVIRARIRAVTCSCLSTTVLTLYVAVYVAKLAPLETLHVFGCWPIALLDIVRMMLLVATLFAGPLFERIVIESKWRQWKSLVPLKETLGSWIGWRNFIASGEGNVTVLVDASQGPITEELIWRSNVIPLHIFAKVSPGYLVFVTPLYFGIAHIHHFYEFRLTHPDTPLLPAVLRTALQFTYTSLFGFFAAFVFLRTGSLAAAIIAHSVCNWMGLPRLWGRVEAPVLMGPPDASRKEDASPLDAPSPRDFYVAKGQLDVMWTVAYYLLLIGGALGFYHGLWPLTDSRYALVKFNQARTILDTSTSCERSKMLKQLSIASLLWLSVTAHSAVTPASLMPSSINPTSTANVVVIPHSSAKSAAGASPVHTELAKRQSFGDDPWINESELSKSKQKIELNKLDNLNYMVVQRNRDAAVKAQMERLAEWCPASVLKEHPPGLDEAVMVPRALDEVDGLIPFEDEVDGLIPFEDEVDGVLPSEVDDALLSRGIDPVLGALPSGGPDPVGDVLKPRFEKDYGDDLAEGVEKLFLSLVDKQERALVHAGDSYIKEYCLPGVDAESASALSKREPQWGYKHKACWEKCGCKWARSDADTCDASSSSDAATTTTETETEHDVEDRATEGSSDEASANEPREATFPNSYKSVCRTWPYCQKARREDAADEANSLDNDAAASQDSPSSRALLTAAATLPLPAPTSSESTPHGLSPSSTSAVSLPFTAPSPLPTTFEKRVAPAPETAPSTRTISPHLPVPMPQPWPTSTKKCFWGVYCKLKSRYNPGPASNDKSQHQASLIYEDHPHQQLDYTPYPNGQWQRRNADADADGDAVGPVQTAAPGVERRELRLLDADKEGVMPVNGHMKKCKSVVSPGGLMDTRKWCVTYPESDPDAAPLPGNDNRIH
ncbi:MAG: hypothetical protein M1828_007381 [Chrysothrix sp. TS-e1954]|nr:MAG: hypothetical protein M1828_007381 [Chrysothrix sp. TS-e1954]